MRVVLLWIVLLLAGCAAPTPPRPAMAPLGVNGDFGYSSRELGPDKVEVVYRGAAVPVSPIDPNDASKSNGEQAKAHDLALWRAAQVAAERNKAGFTIDSEHGDNDVLVQRRTYYRPNPFYDPFFSPFDDPFWPHTHRIGGPYGNPAYNFQEVRTATSRAQATLSVTLYTVMDPKVAGMLSTGDTLARLQAARSGAVY
jgi:hypothetical protein